MLRNKAKFYMNSRLERIYISQFPLAKLKWGIFFVNCLVNFWGMQYINNVKFTN